MSCDHGELGTECGSLRATLEFRSRFRDRFLGVHERLLDDGGVARPRGGRDREPRAELCETDRNPSVGDVFLEARRVCESGQMADLLSVLLLVPALLRPRVAPRSLNVSL